jgi:UDP-2-acetamido-3-amino-2,3-dideoxy-glucuronate N-acetyltransferase
MRNIAVLGCGQWGKNPVRNFAELGAFRAVCDAEPTKLAMIRECWPGVRATASYQEILDDETVTGAVVATPAGSHYTLAKEALPADKDVFVEKPLALKVS